MFMQGTYYLTRYGKVFILIVIYFSFFKWTNFEQL